ncbi:DUF4349 domain-containing protein [Nakamurella deserti]|uniref:DUF4349 domain-containing protein n=1 Tax=Nakamurella deserti TaxID=2164074 RepID=UPI000DBE4D2B|nr:DUF4349 domain-containing protein [Nakamurella deserti]
MTDTRTTARVGRRWLHVVAAAGAAVLLLASCSGTSDAAGSTSSAAGFPTEAMASAPASAAAAESAGGAAVDAADAQGAAPAAAPLALDNRQIIRTADLQIRLTVPADTPDETLEQTQQEELDKAVNNARAQLLALGGFVADLQQAGNSASLVLRVPAENYEAFRTGAQKLGEVTSSTEAAQDVTEEFTDVESRIASMKVSVDRMRTLLAQATVVADIIAIEGELSRREADLDSLEGRRQVLADQVALGTVSMTLTAVRAAAETAPVAPAEEDRSGFLGGLADGWRGLKSFLTGVGVVVGAVLPFLPLVAVVALLGWWVRRTARRHREQPVSAPRADDPTPA